MFPTSQMPEKSGRPSVIFGAGAVRFGLPSGRRGIPGVGCFTHCALVDAVNNTRTVIVASPVCCLMSVLPRVQAPRARRLALDDVIGRQDSRLLSLPRTGTGRENRTG